MSKKKLFGMLPSEFDKSTANPKRIETMCNSTHKKPKS